MPLPHIFPAYAGHVRERDQQSRSRAQLREDEDGLIQESGAGWEELEFWGEPAAPLEGGGSVERRRSATHRCNLDGMFNFNLEESGEID